MTFSLLSANTFREGILKLEKFSLFVEGERRKGKVVMEGVGDSVTLR
jgi:hypothetical protein